MNGGSAIDLNEVFPAEGILAWASTAGPACAHPILAEGLRWAWSRIQKGRSPTVEDVAALLKMSSRSLNRLFRQELGHTARDFLVTSCMERAAQVLRGQPDWSVQRIAHEAGFSNQGAFSDAFRSWSGRQPRDYRKP